jgi:hypothetical protein
LRQRASGVSPENSIIPNSIEMAVQPSREARSVVNAEPPFAIAHANEAWVALTGGVKSEGGSGLCDVLQLHPSQDEQLYALAADCSIGRPGSAVVIAVSEAAARAGQSPTEAEHLRLIYLKVTGAGTRAAHAHTHIDNSFPLPPTPHK